jgi:hypothetical protein
MMRSFVVYVFLLSISGLASETGAPSTEMLAKAEGGDTKTQIVLGMMAAGQRDFTSAEMWTRQALQAGDKRAAEVLRGIYISPENPERCSPHEATRRLAELGYAEAQIQLGHAYRNGRDVEKNDEEAVKWYGQAAGQGHAGAASHLAEMHAMGLGIKEDLTEGYIWARLSEEWEKGEPAAGRNPAEPRAEPKAKLSEQIAKELSPSEHRRAEAEVEKRMAEHEKREVAR